MAENAARVMAAPAVAGAAPDGIARPGTGTGARRTVNVLGHFRLIRKLGEGAMGTVYQAEDVTDGRIVAVKVLKREMAAPPTALPRLVRRGQMMAPLVHPQVPPRFQVGASHWFHHLLSQPTPVLPTAFW